MSFDVIMSGCCVILSGEISVILAWLEKNVIVNTLVKEFLITFENHTSYTSLHSLSCGS